MLPRIIFCVAVTLAVLTVILLAFISPGPHKNQSKGHTPSTPWLALSLYIQQPQIVSYRTHQPVTQSGVGAFIYRHSLTRGPENTSRTIGKAQGFVVPVEQFAHSPFNIIYLTFATPEYSGSLSVQASQVTHKDSEELTVVGGTGSFAFARGHAILAQTDHQNYHIKLQLNFPNRSRIIPG